MDCAQLPLFQGIHSIDLAVYNIMSHSIVATSRFYVNLSIDIANASATLMVHIQQKQTSHIYGVVLHIE